MANLPQILAYGIILGVFYGLVTIGLALLFGVMRYLNIAHGSFMMIGGYACYWIFTRWGIDPILSIPLVMALMFLIGVLLYWLLFSRLSKVSEEQRINSSLIMAFGLVLILDNTAIALWTTNIRMLNTSYNSIVFEVLGIRIPLTGLIVIGLTTLAILALHLFLSRTYLGKSIRATAQDWEAASLLGVNIDRIYLICCGISLALAGLAGTCLALTPTYTLSPDIGLRWVLFAMVVLVLAGMGNIKEVFLAGLIMAMLEQLSSVVIGPEFRGVVSLAVFILILIFRPEGLFKR
jgi:branched-chain amino acid transport system permease protein